MFFLLQIQHKFKNMFKFIYILHKALVAVFF